MLTFAQGNLFESDAEAWINTVNCVGVMGKGIALQFKQYFPVMFEAYRRLCDKKQLRPGVLHICIRESNMIPRIIINFPTKTDWRRKSEYEYIHAGLAALLEPIKEDNIKTLAMPALGCSNGGLHWPTVKHIISDWHTKHNETLRDVNIIVYEPTGNLL